MPLLKLYDLKCEYQINPLGLGETHPRLSWKLQSSRRGARQSAYQIRCASNPALLASNANLLWDSGHVESDQSVLVEYGGPDLRSGQRVYWDVQVWDEAGDHATGETAFWEMGLLERTAWEPAQWIGGSLVGGVWTSVPLPYLQREFQLEGNVASARLYVTALGLYECWLNGARVGEDWLTPGWTDYNKRVQYQVYDVTALLEPGANAWGAILGDGWYCGNIMLSGRQVYGDRPRLFAKLIVTYSDGRTEAIVTDDKWRVHYGAMLASDIYNGESYDARLEEDGWNKPGFKSSGWLSVNLFPDPGIELSASYGAPVRVMEEIRPIADPVEFKGFPSSRWIFDFGQNLVGRTRVTLQGANDTAIRLRFAEVLNPDGTLYTANLRSAQQTDTFAPNNAGDATWEPRFTFHGFRYVELFNYHGPVTRDTLTAIVMHSNTLPTGTFECSERLVNQLQKNIVWGQRGNFVDVPTDCPQRDERLGWLGDAQVFVRTAAFNMDVAAFFWKWMRDVTDTQSPRGAYSAVAPSPGTFTLTDGGPAWADAGIICPWTIYLAYGDTRMLERQYASMQRFFEYLKETSLDDVRPAPDPQLWQGFGDWLSLDATASSEQALGGDREGGTPKRLIGTAFFAHAADRLSQIARLLHHNDDAERYMQEFARIRGAFLKSFVSADGTLTGNTQTAYVLALHFDLLPVELRAAALRKLVELIQARGTHLATGFVGTPYLNHVLTQNGRGDIAYALLLQQTYPSWLFPVLNGATTIWERWDGWTPERGFQDAGMNSFNHYAYGAIGDWLYSSVAGIDVDPTQPGYKHIRLHPTPHPALTFARATYESLYGRIESEWHADGDALAWRVVIPPNTSATISLPPKSILLEQNAQNGDWQAVEAARSFGSGEYSFRISSG